MYRNSFTAKHLIPVIFACLVFQSPLSAAMKRYTLKVGGQSRVYYLKLPAGYKTKAPLRMVYLLHGYQPGRYNGGLSFLKAADASISFPSTVLVVPTLLKTGRPAWNPADDDPFLKRLHTKLWRRLGRYINRREVYSIGFSMGANYAFQASFKQVLPVSAAAGIGGGIRWEDDSQIKRSIPVLLVMGDREPKHRRKYGRESYRKLKEWGVRTEFTDIPYTGHGINLHVMARVFDWLQNETTRRWKKEPDIEYKGIPFTDLELGHNTSH